MANSEDPDETAVSSGSKLFALASVLVFRTERVYLWLLVLNGRFMAIFSNGFGYIW